MRKTHKTVILEIIKSVLRELSDFEFQQRVWVMGSPIETSSMNEAVAELFNDSGLDIALEKNDVTFTPELDAELRELRVKLRSSMLDQATHGTSAVISSPEWMAVRCQATHILELLGKYH